MIEDYLWFMLRIASLVFMVVGVCMLGTRAVEWINEWEENMWD